MLYCHSYIYIQNREDLTNCSPETPTSLLEQKLEMIAMASLTNLWTVQHAVLDRNSNSFKKAAHGKFTACMAGMTGVKCDTMNIFFISTSNS